MSPISDRLLSSACHLGEMPSGALLLNDNAHYPWFLIVPYGEFVEWTDLPMELQQKMLIDLNSLTRFLLEDKALHVEKVNTAAIGNIVSQFHLHILGRNSSDPAWPGPVWGHEEKRDYETEEREGLVKRLAAAVGDFAPL